MWPHPCSCRSLYGVECRSQSQAKKPHPSALVIYAAGLSPIALTEAIHYACPPANWPRIRDLIQILSPKHSREALRPELAELRQLIDFDLQLRLLV